LELGHRGNTKQYDGTATSWNIIKIYPLPITMVSPGSRGAWVYILDTTEA